MNENPHRLSKMERKLVRAAQRRKQREAANDDAQPAEAAQARPMRKRVKSLLETTAAELDELELEILEEMLQTAREAIALHRAEVRERLALRADGKASLARWEVAPGVADKLMAKVQRIIQIRVARRAALKHKAAA